MANYYATNSYVDPANRLVDRYQQKRTAAEWAAVLLS